jgi:integrase
MSKLTKQFVDKTKPNGRDYFLWDDELPGFGLRVFESGKKSYLVQYRVGKRSRRITIGLHGPITPEQARKSALSLLSRIKHGEDPAEDKIQERQALTIQELCSLYFQEGCATKKPSTLKSDKGRIERHIIPLLGHYRVKDLTRSDIERFMQDVASGKTSVDIKTGFRGRAIVSGGKGTATRTVGLLGGILTFAMNHRICSANPVRGVKRYPDQKCTRFLGKSELSKLGRVLMDITAEGSESSATIAIVKLLLLTGCRKSEILTLKWEYVDFQRGYLYLPDSKTGAKAVPVSNAALEILRNIEKHPTSSYIFSNMKADSYFVGFPKAWERIKRRAGLDGMRLHDLRHSFASIGASSGDSLLVIGKILGHKDPKTTQRYAHLDNDPVREAVERIGKMVTKSINPKSEKGQ